MSWIALSLILVAVVFAALVVLAVVFTARWLADFARRDQKHFGR